MSDPSEQEPNHETELEDDVAKRNRPRASDLPLQRVDGQWVEATPPSPSPTALSQAPEGTLVHGARPTLHQSRGLCPPSLHSAIATLESDCGLGLSHPQEYPLLRFLPTSRTRVSPLASLFPCGKLRRGFLVSE